MTMKANERINEPARNSNHEALTRSSTLIELDTKELAQIAGGYKVGSGPSGNVG